MQSCRSQRQCAEFSMDGAGVRVSGSDLRFGLFPSDPVTRGKFGGGGQENQFGGCCIRRDKNQGSRSRAGWTPWHLDVELPTPWSRMGMRGRGHEPLLSTEPSCPNELQRPGHQETKGTPL